MHENQFRSSSYSHIHGNDFLYTRCQRVSGLKSKSNQKNIVSGKQRVYRGDSLRTILFPVGGIESGYIMVGGRGNIQEFLFVEEQEDADSLLAFFGIWAKEGKEFNSVEDVEFEPMVWIMEGRILLEQSGCATANSILAGIQRFREASFAGNFPFGVLELSDRDVPVHAALGMFNPFIPLDKDNGSLPACILHWTLRNHLQKPVEVSLLFSISGSNFSKVEKISIGGKQGIKVKGGQNSGFRELVALSSPEAAIQSHTHQNILWNDFADDGELESQEAKHAYKPAGSSINSIWLKQLLDPGEGCFRFNLPGCPVCLCLDSR